MKKYRIENREKLLEYRKLYYIKNSEKEKQYRRQYYADNKYRILRIKNKDGEKKYYIENRNELIENSKEYYYKYKDEIKKRSKQYYNDNSGRIKKRVKQYRRDNPEKIKITYEKGYENRKKYYCENIERIQKVARQYRENHKEQINQKLRNRRKTDLKFNLNARMSSAISSSLKDGKKGRHWEVLVNYTLSELKNYLKKTMPKEYTWQDFMKGRLHIDHIIPKSIFNYTKPEHIDFERCWDLSNLRLLPARENHRKKDKLIRPFQPALKI